jgi:hypothetical protein
VCASRGEILDHSQGSFGIGGWAASSFTRAQALGSFRAGLSARRENSKSASWRRCLKPRQPDEPGHLASERERIGCLQIAVERFEGRHCLQVDRELLAVSAHRRVMNDLDLEARQARGRRGRLDLVRPTVPLNCDKARRRCNDVARRRPRACWRSGGFGSSRAVYRASVSDPVAGRP